MAAQDAGRRVRVCERCFATVSQKEETCPECGAPMDSGAVSWADPSTIPDLARANLLRMRGEYKLAEDQCLKILRRLPNNASANTLLGDICAERGDLEEAVQWYELALELVPNEPVSQQKRESAMVRIRDREAAASVEHLGLRSTQIKWPLVAGIGFCVLALCALGAYTIGQGRSAKNGLIDNALHVPKTDNSTTASTDTSTQADTTPTHVAPKPVVDATLQTFVDSKTDDTARILAATVDPRAKSATLTYSVGEGEIPNALGARLAEGVLDAVASLASATVRAMRGDNIVFIADVMRASVDETRSQAWHDAHADEPDAWMTHVLSHIWSADAAATTTPSAPDGAQASPSDVGGASTQNPGGND